MTKRPTIEEIKKILKANESVRSDDEGINDNRPDLWMHYISEDDYDKVAKQLSKLFEAEKKALEDRIFAEIEKVKQDIDEDGKETNDPTKVVETIYFIGKGRLNDLKKREGIK